MTTDTTAIYGTCTPVVDAQFDPGDGSSFSEAVVDAIAEATQVAPTDLPPIYHSVDLDALSVVFTSERAPVGQIFVFAYEGWQIFVRGDGRIRVCDPASTLDPAPIFEDDQ